MKYILCIIILLFSGVCHSHPEKDCWELTEKELKWQPSDPIEWFFPGGFKMETVFLFKGVKAPFDGLILLSDDWSEIQRIVNNIEKEKEKIKKEERELCDSLLEERDKKCKELNKSLLEKIDHLEDKNSRLDKQFNNLENDHFYLKVISAVVVSGLSTYIVVDKLSD